MVLKIHPFPGQAAWSMPRCDSEDDDPPEVAGAMPVPPVPVPRGGRSSEDLQNLAMENAWHQRTLRGNPQISWKNHNGSMVSCRFPLKLIY